MFVSNPASPLIENNVIHKNDAGGLGGGIWVSEKSSPIIRGNDFFGNEALRGDGGAIAVIRFSSGMVITENLFYGDAAWDKGGAVYIAGGPDVPAVEISWNTFYFTLSRAIPEIDGGGGAVWLTRVSAQVRNNTVRRVQSNPGGLPNGGAITIKAPGAYTIKNNIVAFSGRGGGLVCVNSPVLNVTDNLFWSNVDGDIDGSCSGLVDSEANVFLDPLFCDAWWFSSVANTSPALTHPQGLIGRDRESGCVISAGVETTWGWIKSRYK